MKNVLQVKDNVVINVTVQFDDFNCEQNSTVEQVWLDDDGVHGIGDIYDPITKELTKPLPELVVDTENV